MTNDIVTELDRWLAVYDFAGLIDVAVMQRTRDEIVALRRYKLENDEALGVIRRAAALVETTPKVSEAKRLIRDAALEEAAWVVEMHWGIGEATCVAEAIRALKEKAHGAVVKYSIK